MLVTIEKVLVLKQIQLFKAVSNMALSDLMSLSEEYTFKKGAILIQEEEQNQNLYIILSGTVRVGSKKQSRIVEAHETLGLESVFLIGEAGVRAVTQERTVLLKVNRDKLYRMMALHPSLAKAILHALSEQIHQA